MKRNLFMLAALILADVALAQQVVPVAGAEDVRLRNLSLFDPAMVTLRFDAEDQPPVTAGALKLDPGEELVIADVTRTLFGLRQSPGGQIIVLGPEAVVAEWRATALGTKSWKPSVAVINSSAAIAAAAAGSRRRGTSRRPGQLVEVPTLVRVGDATAFTGSYGVSGTATIVAKNVIRLSELRHNGTAPGIDMRIGLSTTARRNFPVLRVTARQPFNNATLDLTLPDTIDLNSFDTFTVWCYEFNVIIAEGRFQRP
ncbi:MAG TPA: DM13 domain-containing protein [Thermoanaerobaculia bacterium]|nr:DM13 domain-containing protein [Thermoanaerobaculia bacterium]